MKITGIGKSHIGMVRSTNQDAYYIDNNQSVYMVADGMGGHAGGEIASKMCVDSLEHRVKRQDDKPESDSDFHIFLERTLNKACTEIYEKSLENPDLKGMGTTASCVYINNNKAHCGHVGDSRIYMIRCGIIYQLSVDHSLVSEQLKAGLITQKMAENHQLKNVITRSIGYQEEEFVDTFTQQLERGDLLLICSDGLHGKISDQEIVEICNQDVSSSPDKLIDLANARGGEDNITAIVIEVTE